MGRHTSNLPGDPHDRRPLSGNELRHTERRSREQHDAEGVRVHRRGPVRPPIHQP